MNLTDRITWTVQDDTRHTDELWHEVYERGEPYVMDMSDSDWDLYRLATVVSLVAALLIVLALATVILLP